MIGKTYGNFLVLELSHKSKSNGNVYKCLCKSCNTRIMLVSESRLINGKAFDCGCIKRSKDLVGKRFNKFVVLERCEKSEKYREFKWKCRCDCGNIRNVFSSHLTHNYITHCGCENNILKTNLSKTQIHNVWRDMKKRASSNPLYTKKGIVVCDEWQGKYGFINFYNWAIENGYKEEKLSSGRNKWTLDRIDNDGNYEPSNCRWITNGEQQYNKDNTIYIYYNNVKYNLLELENEIGKPRDFIYAKYKKGYSIDEIKNMEYIEKEKKKLNVNYDIIYKQGYIPLVELAQKHNITEKRWRIFMEKNIVEKKIINKRNCIKIEDVQKFEEYFGIKKECI